MTLDIEKLENHLKAELESDRLDADPQQYFALSALLSRKPIALLQQQRIK